MLPNILTMPRPGAFVPSAYQEAVYSWVEKHVDLHGQASLLIEAVAGSGKTSTIEEIGLRLPPGRKVIYVAFTQHIADELRPRVMGKEVKTAHSLGLGALYQKLPRLTVDKENYKYRDRYTSTATSLSAVLLGFHAEGRLQESPLEYQELRENISKIVEMTMLSCVEPGDVATMVRLAEDYDAEGNTDEETYYTCLACAEIIEEGVVQAQTEGVIAFLDMLYLPLRWDLRLPVRDWVLVDERQDLSPAALRMIMKLRGPHTKMVFVGDENQAIFRFAGASTDNVRRLKEITNAEELPLSICYRCPEKVVELAKRFVPQIEARPSAPLGEVGVLRRGQVASQVRAGDLILCRTTAPLVTLCIALIRERVAATVRGRDLSKGLVRVVHDVEKVEEYTWAEFPKFLDLHRVQMLEKLSVKRNGDEKSARFLDSCAGVQVCHEAFPARDAAQLVREIEHLFSDEKSAVVLSTVHRAKGLQNPRVMILGPEKMPLVWRGQGEDDARQERNLIYVAMTRAQETLYFVTDVDGGWWPGNLVIPVATKMAPAPKEEAGKKVRCLFCGGVLFPEQWGDSEGYALTCEDCGAWGPKKSTPDEARKAYRVK